MRFLSLLLLALATFSLAQDYEEETEDAIAEGRRRLRRIPSPQTQRDNNQVCDIRQYGITPYRASTPSILSSFSARIGGSWQRIDAVFPKSYAGTNLDAPFRAICAYNPAGAIAFFDIANDRPTGAPPYSIADLSWAVYKSVVDVAVAGGNPQHARWGMNDYRNIRYIIHTDVTSDGADEVFEDMGIEPGRTSTFTDQSSDEFRAFLGLDNGATVAGLLTGHNQEMGRKRIRSVSATMTRDGSPLLWWELV